jgi:hypothetical protein
MRPKARTSGFSNSANPCSWRLAADASSARSNDTHACPRSASVLRIAMPATCPNCENSPNSARFIAAFLARSFRFRT